MNLELRAQSERPDALFAATALAPHGDLAISPARSPVDVQLASGCLAFELLRELFACTLGTVVVVALFGSGGPVTEWVPASKDLVLDPVPREGSCRTVPALCVMAAVGSFAERVAGPVGAAFDFAVGEVVAELGVLAGKRVDHVRQTVAFFVDRGGIAELAGERRTLCERAFELVLGAGERRGEPRAIDEVRILASAEAALAGLGESVEGAARRAVRSTRASARRVHRAFRVPQ